MRWKGLASEGKGAIAFLGSDRASGVALEDGAAPRKEFMVSLKILR